MSKATNKTLRYTVALTTEVHKCKHDDHIMAVSAAKKFENMRS